MSFCQDTKTRIIKESSLKKIKKEIDKCDSLKVAYNETLKNINELESEILESINKIQELKKEKAENKKLIEDQSLTLNKKKKIFHFGFQLGVYPLYTDNKFLVSPYLGLGVTVPIFSF